MEISRCSWGVSLFGTPKTTYHGESPKHSGGWEPRGGYCSNICPVYHGHQSRHTGSGSVVKPFVGQLSSEMWVQTFLLWPTISSTFHSTLKQEDVRCTKHEHVWPNSQDSDENPQCLPIHSGHWGLIWVGICQEYIPTRISNPIVIQPREYPKK